MFRTADIQLPRRAKRLNLMRLLCAAPILCGLAGLHVAHADNTVIDWNNEFLLVTQQTSGNLVAGPPEVAREIGQIGAAMSDAVNAATGGTISSFAYTGGTVANADPSVAAATAAYTALYSIFSDAAWQTPISTVTGSATANNSNVNLANGTVIPELETFLTNDLSGSGLSPSFSSAGVLSISCTTSVACNGANLGIAAATAVDTSASYSPTASGAVAAIQTGLTAQAPAGSGSTPGVYVPPSASTGGRPEMFPAWNTTTPTGATAAQVSAALGTVKGPPALNSQAYATALLQTECQGSSTGQSGLPANIKSACAAAGFAQTDVQAQQDATAALFWNDPGTTIQPPGHWLQIANDALTSQGSSLLQSAQLTAILGEAMNDAGIAAWTDKYAYNLWRPVTAIRACDSSGTGTVTWNSNFTTCDSNWSSLIATPPHPDYLAGHPAFSGSAATVLADFFGTDTVGFTSTSDAYCNGGTAIPNGNGQTIGCTLNNVTYSLCASGTPVFNATVAVACSDGSALGAGCNTITNPAIGTNSGSPLICPINETFDSFSEASSGPLGSEYSRVVGGIHTPFSVEDALTVGDQIGEIVAANAGLPEIVPEPSALSLCALSLLAICRLRRRQSVPA